MPDRAQQGREKKRTWDTWRCPECGAGWIDNDDEPGVIVLGPECGPCGCEMERVGPVVPLSALLSDEVVDLLAKRIAPRRPLRTDWALSDVRHECRLIARRDLKALAATLSGEGSR